MRRETTMATHRTSSKNSALKDTLKTQRTTPGTPTRAALIFRNLEKGLIKIGDMPFAREAEVLCLVSHFLRAKGYRAEAKAFSQKAKEKAIFARACQETK
jgi:hypothetical protein